MGIAAKQIKHQIDKYQKKVKIFKGVHGNRKKNRHKKLINKLKVKKENCSLIFNQIRYNIKVEEITAAKF